MSDSELSEDKLKTVFESLKSGKSPGYDEMNPNVIKSCYNEL